MLILTTWKTHPLSPEKLTRMVPIWGAQVEQHAKNPAWTELFNCTLIDGSGGFTLAEAADQDAANLRGLQIALELREFMEIGMKPVFRIEDALPAVMAAVATKTS
jgi:hypothetical protein